MQKFKITSIATDDNGSLQIGYYNADTDVKVAGVAKIHTLLVPGGFDYDDEIAAVIDAAQYLVNDVLEDWKALKDVATARREALEESVGADDDDEIEGDEESWAVREVPMQP